MFMKRTVSALVALLLALVLCLHLPFAAVAAAVGDINQDGNIDASDALIALQSSVKLKELTDAETTLANVDGKGEVDASDALLILQYSVKLIHSFPADIGTSTVSIPWSAENKAILQSTDAFELEGAHTISQSANTYNTDMDLPTGSAMLYIQSIEGAQSMYDSWKDSGRDLSVMIMAGRDGNNEYFNLYPEREYKDVHTSADGTLKLHSGTAYYMLPTRYYAKYKLDLVKKVCEFEPTYLAIEEPEVFVYDTYAEGFQEEWEDYYNEPWQDPLSSAEARYKTSKLITQLWVNYYQQVRDYIDANCPDIKLLVAAHDVLNYDHHQIVSTLSTLTSLNIVDGVIGQTWSDCIYGAGSAYGGGYPRRLFERAWIEYASYSDTMEEGQELFTLSDAKADGEGWGWDIYEQVWKLSVVTQLLNPDLHQFQSYIWPHRAFSADTPEAYRTKQLNIFNAMSTVGGQEVNLYAGTSGISLAMSDTLTWQYGSQYMPVSNTQDGIHSLSLPIIEWGIPLEVTTLDKVTSAQDLEGIKVLILSYDIMKPLSEEVNQAVADWVKQGGSLLYVGGHDAAESISGEWWSDKGQTPLENLLSHLGLDVQVGSLDGTITALDWQGDDCQSFDDEILLTNMADHAATFSGEGITPVLLEMYGLCLGFEANVGQGAVVMLGLPSSYFASSEIGPENLRELAKYTVNKHSDTSWVETDLMVSQRGRYIAAQALNYTDGETLSGNFIDLFDEKLTILEQKELAANDSALLYDITELLTPGTPRLGFTGGELVGDVTETSDTTTFSIKGPTSASSATRLLGNGRYPKSITVTCGGQRYLNYTEAWDNETNSLLLLVDNSISPAIDITVEWSDEPIADTEPYEWVADIYSANSNNADAAFILRDDSTATRSMRRVVDGELVYKFDLSKINSPYFKFVVGANYLLEISVDGNIYSEVARYDGEPVESVSNRTTVTVYPDQVDATDTLYVRLKTSESTPSYGGAIFDFTIYQKQPKS